MNIHILPVAILRAPLSTPLPPSFHSEHCSSGKKKLSRVKNVMKLENYVRSSFRANVTHFRFPFFSPVPPCNCVSYPLNIFVHLRRTRKDIGRISFLHIFSRVLSTVEVSNIFYRGKNVSVHPGRLKLVRLSRWF